MEPLHERWTETCTFCPTLCLFTCPVSNAEGRDTVAPWGKMSLVRWVARGQLPLDEETAAIAYKCLGCLACWATCRHDVEVPTVLFAARAGAVAAGVRPFPLATFAPPAEEDLVAALRQASPAERWVEEAQVLLVPGEDTLRKSPGLVSEVFQVADRLGLDYLATAAPAAFDSGYELYCGGYLAELRSQAERVQAALARYRKLVVAAPHTLYMLRVVYPQIGVSIAPVVQDLASFLLEALRTRPPQRKLPGTVRYHDPCYLGRHLEIFDAPRALLRLLCENPPEELRWHHKESHCCGGGGGLPRTSPTTAAHAARTVVDNARELDSDRLVSACASCVHMLGEQAEGLRVEHLASTVLAALNLAKERRRR